MSDKKFKYIIEHTSADSHFKYRVSVFVWSVQERWLEIGSSLTSTKWGARWRARRIKDKYLHNQKYERPVEVGEL